MGGIAKSLSCQFVPGLWVTTDIFLSLDYIEGWQTQTIEFFFLEPLDLVCLFGGSGIRSTPCPSPR